jgi:hypothetical protein
MSRSKYGTTFAICSDRQTERTTRATDPDHGMTHKCVKDRSGSYRTTNHDKFDLGGRILLRSLRVLNVGRAAKRAALDTTQPWAHAHISGLVVSGTVCHGRGACSSECVAHRPARLFEGLGGCSGPIKTAGSILISLGLTCGLIRVSSAVSAVDYQASVQARPSPTERV